MIAKSTFELVFKNAKKVPVQVLPHINQILIPRIRDSKKFKDYADKIEKADEGVEVKKIQILGVQMFGDKVGFLNLRVATEKDGFPLPSYVFIRGPSVAILMIVNDKLLVVEQYRVPIQKNIIEAPAGMLDESGDFVGTAAVEIYEETSIRIKREDLHSLGSYYPSVGGSQEQIQMFCCKVKVPEEQMKEIREKIHGKQGERERIKVKLIDYNMETILNTKDSKLICLVYAYENSKIKSSL